MPCRSISLRRLSATSAVIGSCLFASAQAAPPKVVTTPNSDPQCFAPWATDTKLFQFPAKKGQAGPCPSVALYRVGPEYETKALAAVRTQLAKAGVRLARLLRDGFK